jgi:hypothetical protein
MHSQTSIALEIKNGDCLTIEVIGSGGGGNIDWGGGNAGCQASCAGGGDTSSSGSNAVIDLPKGPDGAINWIKVFKTVKAFCKSSGESCTPGWSTRMTVGAPGVKAICQQVGIALQGPCNAEVTLESAVGNCDNVSGC